MNAEPYSDLNRFAIPKDKSVLYITTGNVATDRKALLELQYRLIKILHRKSTQFGITATYRSVQYRAHVLEI